MEEAYGLSARGNSVLFALRSALARFDCGTVTAYRLAGHRVQTALQSTRMFTTGAARGDLTSPNSLPSSWAAISGWADWNGGVLLVDGACRWSVSQEEEMAYHVPNISTRPFGTTESHER